MLKILTIETLAAKLGLASDELVALASRAPRMYRKREMPKKGGKGIRIINPPHTLLKRVQRRLLDSILVKLPSNAALLGGKGSAPKDAVMRHVRKPLVVTIDLSDFFPSISRAMVRRTLQRLGAKPDVAQLMTRLMTHDNHLPQGAPTSPRMAMLVLNPVARNIERALSSIPNVDLSVWVDDATISGPEGIERIIPTIIQILGRYGFRVHPEKLKIMPQTSEQVSLGIKLNDGLAVPTTFLNKYHKEGRPLPVNNPKRKGMEAYMRSITQ